MSFAGRRCHVKSPMHRAAFAKIIAPTSAELERYIERIKRAIAEHPGKSVPAYRDMLEESYGLKLSRDVVKRFFKKHKLLEVTPIARPPPRSSAVRIQLALFASPPWSIYAIIVLI